MTEPVSTSDASKPQRSESPLPGLEMESASSDSSRSGQRRARSASGRPMPNHGATEKSVDTAGPDLERRVARLEFAEGALSRLRVPVLVDAEAGRDVLTDVDVLTLDFDNRLRISRAIVECKSGKGQSGEGDRLLWLSGLQRLMGVDRAVLVRQTITRRGRALARSLGLRILDVPTLSSREAAHAWLPERFAHIDGSACTDAEARTDRQLKGLGHIPSELVAFLRNRSLLEPSSRGLGAVDTLRQVVELGGILPKPTGQILAGHALQTVLLAALQDAATLDTVPADELRRRLTLALTVGTPDDDHLLAVLGQADAVVGKFVDRIHGAYVESGADRLDVQPPLLRSLVATPPNWIDRYLDLVLKMRANPTIARDLPQTVELAAFDAMLGDDAYRAAAFGHLFTPEHRSLLVATLRCVRDIAGTQLTDLLSPVGELDFNRRAPTLPDRSSGASTSHHAEPPPAPASPTAS